MQRVIIIPNILFEGRQIALEAYGPIDREGDKLAMALSQIMRERIFAKTRNEHPIIRPVIVPARRPETRGQGVKN